MNCLIYSHNEHIYYSLKQLPASSFFHKKLTKAAQVIITDLLFEVCCVHSEKAVHQQSSFFCHNFSHTLSKDVLYQRQSPTQHRAGEWLQYSKRDHYKQPKLCKWNIIFHHSLHTNKARYKIEYCCFLNHPDFEQTYT